MNLSYIALALLESLSPLQCLKVSAALAKHPNVPELIVYDFGRDRLSETQVQLLMAVLLANDIHIVRNFLRTSPYRSAYQTA